MVVYRRFSEPDVVRLMRLTSAWSVCLTYNAQYSTDDGQKRFDNESSMPCSLPAHACLLLCGSIFRPHLLRRGLWWNTISSLHDYR